MENILYEHYRDKDTMLRVWRSRDVSVKTHFHRCIEILYVEDGNMLATVEGKHFSAQEDDIVFVHGYCKHSFLPAPRYRKLVMVIPSEFSDDFDAAFRDSTLPCLLGDKAFNREVLRPVYETLVLGGGTMPPLVQKGYLNVMLGNMLAHYPSVPISRSSNIELLVNILNYIDQNYNRPLTLDALAATFGYNKYHFSRLFNRAVGESLSNYINVVRLQHFVRLGKEDRTASVAELAFSCGFDSLTTFYRCFSKLYDVPPRAVLSSAT